MAFEPSKNRKYQLNENFFDVIDTEEKSYLLGFLYADGNISNNKYQIKIEVNEKDIDILQKFKMSLKSESPIRQYRNNTKTFFVDSKYMAMQLKKIGCTPKKSLTLKFPEWLDENLYNHFIRGYFDGDGCICYNKCNNSVYFILVGTKNFLENIQKVFMKKFELNKTLLKQTNHNDNYYLKYCGNNQCFKIFNWLYADSKIYLNRKFNKFEKYFHTNI